MIPGNFPPTGLKESKSASYFALSVAVTAQLKDLGWFPVGEVRDEKDPCEVAVIAFCIMAGGCSPWK